MRIILIRLGNLAKHHPQLVEGLLIFLTCIFAYLANHQLISADDMFRILCWL
jgi:hypothetical protein